jgi:hypothetical protein
MYNYFLKTPQMFLKMIFFISSITMPITKIDQIPNLQIEHSHPIIGPIVTQKFFFFFFFFFFLIGHFMTTIFLTSYNQI